MVSTANVRLLFGLKAHLYLSIEHFDIIAASLHKAFGYDKTV